MTFVSGTDFREKQGFDHSICIIRIWSSVAWQPYNVPWRHNWMTSTADTQNILRDIRNSSFCLTVQSTRERRARQTYLWSQVYAQYI